MVASGSGVTLLPALAAKTENKNGRLALRPFGAPAPSRTLALAWRKHAASAAVLRAVAAQLKALV